jgi:hypothetical protein
MFASTGRKLNSFSVSENVLELIDIHIYTCITTSMREDKPVIKTETVTNLASKFEEYFPHPYF